jgi:hypothetical protein
MWPIAREFGADSCGPTAGRCRGGERLPTGASAGVIRGSCSPCGEVIPLTAIRAVLLLARVWCGRAH